MSWSHNIYCGNNGLNSSLKQYSPNAIPVTICNNGTLSINVRMASTPYNPGSNYTYNSVYAWTHLIDEQDVKQISSLTTYSDIYINPSLGLGFIVYMLSFSKSVQFSVNGITVGTVKMSSSTSTLYTIANHAIEGANSISIVVTPAKITGTDKVEITTY